MAWLIRNAIRGLPNAPNMYRDPRTSGGDWTFNADHVDLFLMAASGAPRLFRRQPHPTVSFRHVVPLISMGVWDSEAWSQEASRSPDVGVPAVAQRSHMTMDFGRLPGDPDTSSAFTLGLLGRGSGGSSHALSTRWHCKCCRDAPNKPEMGSDRLGSGKGTIALASSLLGTTSRRV
jgi:hypothetical protein